LRLRRVFACPLSSIEKLRSAFVRLMLLFEEAIGWNDFDSPAIDPL
jgi:hypothetical protein